MIHILPDSIVKKIAAGEVIQKPFNVAKELVENSIDAGATSITVELDGIRNITVSDNGSGMSREDALLACSKHATSKITVEKDLDSISTLGFRGEALASIAAVSNLTLKTSNSSSGEGIELRLSGNQASDKPIGMPRGTTIDVRDLFYNMPARRKFLDAEISELKKIIEVARDYSLAYPGVSFEVKDKNSTLFKALVGDLEARTSDVLKEVAKNLVSVSASNGYAKLHGFVGKPGFVRKDRRYQFVFVNRRLVKNELVERAVFDSLPILPSHHPVFVLFLEISPQKVDVNIHPNKLEVKFSDPDQVYALVSSAVVPLASRKAEISGKVELSQRKGNVYEVVKGKQETLTVPGSGFRVASSETERPRLETQNPKPETDYRIIGQLNLTYILCESRGSLVLLDQHAVQEKIFFEKLFSQPAKQEKKQELISPVVIDFGIEFGTVKAHMELLVKKGVDIEEFGEKSMVVRAVPAAFVDYYGSVTADSLNDLVLNIRLWEKDFAGAEYDKYATKACRGAIKAGRELTLSEMERLVSELQRCKNPNTCPHGRPIAVKISIGEFEKKFKRSV